MSTDLLARADRLRAQRTPFVLATVVRAERPTSAKAGDRAIVLGDGTIEGFVGGVCAESTVRLEGLRLLAGGDSTLLRITPTDDGAVSTEAVPEGLVVVGNPCLSGGTLDIFLEAVLPATLVHVFGNAPIARAVATVAEAAGFAVTHATDAAAPLAEDTAAVVVASHGRDEEPVLEQALRAGIGYVGLVASRKRAAAVAGHTGRPRRAAGPRAQPGRAGHRRPDPAGDRGVGRRRARLGPRRPRPAAAPAGPPAPADGGAGHGRATPPSTRSAT